MAESKHTPGPWKMGEEHETKVEIDGGVPRRTIARVTGGLLPRGTKEMQANARLIAAAPELLLALKNALDCTDHDGECPESGFDAAPDTCTCWRAGARAVIARAEARP